MAIHMQAYHNLFRASAEVNLSAIRQNLINILKNVPESATPVAVIKADGYGHGALPVAKAVDDLVSAYAVATVDEAVELRCGGFDKPIYILGFAYPNSYETLVALDIIPAIFKLDDAKKLSEAAVRLGKTAKINIKVDTGMGRIGFLPNGSAIDDICAAAVLPGIETYGIFTHFATSDYKDKSYANLQFDIFESFISQLTARGVTFKTVHCANSAAAMEMPCTAKNEVRIGISLYGLYPSDEVSRDIALTPAMSFKSHIIYIKEVEAGTSIGYGQTFKTIRKSRIATVPVGYADGYSRRLSSYGRVIVNGYYAPIVGRICMDMFMIDITDIPDVNEYDEVILMGSQGDCSISADDIARLMGTISYEILTAIGKRVPRVYITK